MNARFPRAVALVTLALACAVTAAGAAEPAAQNTVGLGFHDASEPIGVRWWFNPAMGVGLDVGLGFSAEKTVATLDLLPAGGDGIDDTQVEQTLGQWSAGAGVPWVAWQWENVRVLLRPGFSFQSEDDFGEFFSTGNRVKLNTMSASGELEVEVPIANRVTISAAQGVEYKTSKLDLPNAVRDWSLTSSGQGFTHLGFHVYLWGGK